MSTDAKKPVIKQEVTDLAAVIKKAMNIDKKTGAITVAEDVYTSTLGSTSVTEAQIKELQKHNATFVAAANLATAELATPVMKQQKLDEVKAKFPMVGRESLEVDYRQSKEVTIPSAPEGQNKKTVYGVLTSKLTIHGVNAAAGSLKAVKAQVAEQAAAAFAKA